MANTVIKTDKQIAMGGCISGEKSKKSSNYR